jgi:phage host-nuclease inhibitor protein Gam
MARLKPVIGKIKSLGDANLAPREIGTPGRGLAAIDADADRRMAEIKAESAKQGEGIRKRIVDLSAALGAYAEYNRDDLFKDKKTVELTFGSFGFRKSTSISVRKTTLELLKKLRMDRFIRIKEEPDKEALAELEDDAL